MLDVLIASPGDARHERHAVEMAIHEWNAHRSEVEGVILRPRLWEIASVPLSGHGDGQSVINTQLVDNADIVIAIFSHRLGTPTPRAQSGTAEEVDRSIQSGKLVHLYFRNSTAPYSADEEQLARLREFRWSMESEGLVTWFNHVYELNVLVPRAIEYDLRVLRSQPTNS
jgi:hypothetical protein